jgi:6-pyruvoyltetrahydropterin/6-carboxytetrahydropterin synthase
MIACQDVTRPTAHRLFIGKDNHKFFVAHMTVLPSGQKERLHGHNYMVQVAIDLRDISFANFLHFDVFKRSLEAICKDWDEHVLLAAHNPFFELVRQDAAELEFRLCGKRYVLPDDEVIVLPIENIVCETLAQELCRQWVARMGDALDRKLVASLEVSVTETRGQGASYFHVVS